MKAVLFELFRVETIPFDLSIYRARIRELVDRKGHAFIDYKGASLVIPRVRLANKLSALEAWDALESPLVRRPGMVFRMEEMFYCPKELAEVILESE